MEFVSQPEDSLQMYIKRMARIEIIKNKYKGKKIVFTCSCFDLLHYGHILLLETAKKQGDVLIVGVQTDPSIDRKEKNKPIQNYESRYNMVAAIKYVDDVIHYSTEAELYELLVKLNPDVRVLGSDYEGARYTGDDLSIKIVFHPRNYTYSTSGLRELIYTREKERLAKEEKAKTNDVNAE